MDLDLWDCLKEEKVTSYNKKYSSFFVHEVFCIVYLLVIPVHARYSIAQWLRLAWSSFFLFLVFLATTINSKPCYLQILLQIQREAQVKRYGQT